MNPNEPLVLPPGTAPDDATAARIVACWNACQGISTEALNAGAVKAAVDATIYKDVRSVIPHPYANEIRFARNADGTAEITVHPATDGYRPDVPA